MEQFVSMEHFFVPMERFDRIEQIIIFVLMEQFVPFVPMVRLDPDEQILIFVSVVQLNAINLNNKF